MNVCAEGQGEVESDEMGGPLAGEVLAGVCGVSLVWVLVLVVLVGEAEQVGVGECCFGSFGEDFDGGCG